MATHRETSVHSSLLLRLVIGAWPAWLLLAALLSVNALVIEPRLGALLDYWYTPAVQVEGVDTAPLRHMREQAVQQRGLLLMAAPVGLLFLLQLVWVLFVRPAEPEEAGQDDGTADLNGAEKALLQQAQLTLIRDTSAAKDGVQSLKSIAGQPLRGPVNPDQTMIRGADGPTELMPTLPLLEDEGFLFIGNGRYRVERLLASGGMGSVHKGYDTVLERDVAIKELDVNLAQDREQTDRFRQEARALAGLAHPYIVPVYDLLEDNDRFWIVMELLSGGDLDQRINQRRPGIKTTLNIIRAIAEGLAYAHNKGMVHRDIKPMNILFSNDGVPKLVDFGIAKLAQSQQSVVQTRDGLSLGSPTYMSPEQVKGKKDIDKRADIYALGITLYKTLTGEVPFTGDVDEVMRQHIFEQPRSPRELNPDITPDVEAIVLKMLAKNPDERFQDLESFVVAVKALPVA